MHGTCMLQCDRFKPQIRLLRRHIGIAKFTCVGSRCTSRQEKLRTGLRVHVCTQQSNGIAALLVILILRMCTYAQQCPIRDACTRV